MCAALSAVGCLDPGAPRPSTPTHSEILPPQARAARLSTAVAFHVHGWSNHAGNSRPASIAWQSQQYAAAGAQVLWWTDHSDIFTGTRPDLVVTPVAPARIGPARWLVGSWDGGRGDAAIDAGTGDSVYQTSDSGVVAVSVAVGSIGAIDTIRLRFGYRPDSLTFQKAPLPLLARPLVAAPDFRFAVWPVAPTSAVPAVRILVPLAWHPRDPAGYREVIEYRLAAPDSQRSVTTDGDTVFVADRLAMGDSAPIDLSPGSDAAMLPDGEDNTTDDYVVEFAIPEQPLAQVLRFRFPSITNAMRAPDTLMGDAIRAARASATAFGIRALWGIEVPAQNAAIQSSVWNADAGAGRHLAVYLPRDVAPGDLGSIGGSPPNVTAAVHSLGGVVALAHPFGTYGTFPMDSPDETARAVADLGSFLAANRAWGADLLEVGYVLRGHVDFSAHLALLDYLLASGVHICPVGGTDSHGGLVSALPVLGTEDEENFVTWIGGVTPSATGAQFVAALASCETAIGNPFFIRGGLWIDVVTDSSQQESLSLDAAGVTPSAQLFLFEAEIDSAAGPHVPVYRQFHRLTHPGDHPRVGGCLPGFARVEIWAGDRPLGVSNVVFLPAVTRDCP